MIRMTTAMIAAMLATTSGADAQRYYARQKLPIDASSTTGTTGGGPTGTPTPTPTPDPTPTPGDADANWQTCAGEDGFCDFAGTTVVRYGTGDRWATKTAEAGQYCSYKVYGDPAPWESKHCEYDVRTTVTRPSWITCANAGGTCSIPGTAIMRSVDYPTIVSRRATGDTPCDVGVCQYSAATLVPPGGGGGGDPMADAEWAYCSNSYETCEFEGTGYVRYGREDTWAVITSSGPRLTCLPPAFGYDPIQGSSKHCEVDHRTMRVVGWRQCATENFDCDVPGTAQVRYGTGTRFEYRQVTGRIRCSYQVFGDPAPGDAKQCAYRVVYP